MHTFIVFLIIFIVSVLYGIIEFALHQKRIYSIPIRIHVNGTRGKSSVTRLIGAALRQGGFKTITKVTGTYPRLILEDGTETAIYRKTGANIIEQLAVTKFASKRKAEAMVIECMAVQPQYQWITETKMVHSTIGVITNVRMDHVEIMGYSLNEICDSLGKTIPKNHDLFTAENAVFERLKRISEWKNSKIHQVDESIVTDEEMQGFKYLEHKENVALALEISRHLGIKREVALKGMYKAIPDAGVLKLSKVEIFGKRINFLNGFAANDPQSTLMIWEKIKSGNKLKGLRVVLLNTRQDRLERAKQLSWLITTKMMNDFDYLVLIGQSTQMVEDICVENGIKMNRILNLGMTEPESVFDAILSYTENESTVFAIGNMGGMGGAVAEYFENRSVLNG
jgi:gamma-polyglutamate synthase